jgi:DNA adenine methylase
MASRQPVIKWSGSKRLLAPKIVALFPEDYGTYFEPFLGGGSVLLELLPKKAVCCDINASLIDFWNLLKTNPKKLCDDYANNWSLLQKDWHHFLLIRDRYNKEQSGSDLLFLSRTCVNGLIRYNKKGEFNNSLHYSRKGIEPDRLRKLLMDVSEEIQNYTFVSGDYHQTLAMMKEGDLVYLDPPYSNTKSMYYGSIDSKLLWDYVRQIKAKKAVCAMSYDGSTSNRDYSSDVPDGLFSRHLLLESGLSTFNKVIDGVENKTKESLYLTY